MIRFQCPACSKRIKVADTRASRRAKCPACGTSTRVPDGQDSGPVTSALLSEDPLGFLNQEEEPEPAQSDDPLSFLSHQSGEPELPSEMSVGPGVRRVETDDTLKLVLGIAGAMILFAGVFAPFVKMPLIGSVNYFLNGRGDGVVVLIFAVFSFIATLARAFRALWFTGIGTVVVLAITFVSFHVRLEGVERDLAGNPFAPLATSIQLDWGFPVLVIGAGLVIASAAIRPKSTES